MRENPRFCVAHNATFLSLERCLLHICIIGRVDARKAAFIRNVPASNYMFYKTFQIKVLHLAKGSVFDWVILLIHKTNLHMLQKCRIIELSE